jgi:hypothetical protein
MRRRRVGPNRQCQQRRRKHRFDGARAARLQRVQSRAQRAHARARRNRRIGQQRLPRLGSRPTWGAAAGGSCTTARRAWSGARCCPTTVRPGLLPRRPPGRVVTRSIDVTVATALGALRPFAH